MTFAYHRALGPMMWAIFVLAMAEVAIVHLMIGFWYPRVAIGLTLGSLIFVVWLGWAIASFKRMPVELGDATLRMRAGAIKSLDVPISAIAAVIADPSREQITAPGTLDLALIAHPNVLVMLTTPRARAGRWRRPPVVAIAHRLDDPVAFLAALNARIG